MHRKTLGVALVAAALVPSVAAADTTFPHDPYDHSGSGTTVASVAPLSAVADATFTDTNVAQESKLAVDDVHFQLGVGPTAPAPIFDEGSNPGQIKRWMLPAGQYFLTAYSNAGNFRVRVAGTNDTGSGTDITELKGPVPGGTNVLGSLQCKVPAFSGQAASRCLPITANDIDQGTVNGGDQDSIKGGGIGPASTASGSTLDLDLADYFWLKTSNAALASAVNGGLYSNDLTYTLSAP